jgi:hypothetical protein
MGRIIEIKEVTEALLINAKMNNHYYYDTLKLAYDLNLNVIYEEYNSDDAISILFDDSSYLFDKSTKTIFVFDIHHNHISVVQDRKIKLEDFLNLVIGAQ